MLRRKSEYIKNEAVWIRTQIRKGIGGKFKMASIFQKKAFRLPRCFWDYSQQGEQKANGKCKSNLIM